MMLRGRRESDRVRENCSNLNKKKTENYEETEGVRTLLKT